MTDGRVCRTAPAVSAVGHASKEKHRASGGSPQTPLHSVSLDHPNLTSSIMPPCTDTYPPNTTNVRPDHVPYPALPHFDAKTNSDSPSLGRDKPLPPIPSVRDENALEESLQCQRDVLHPSFQTPVVTVQTKTRLICFGKFFHPGHYAYTEPRDLSRNRLSLPPPYTAVDPNAPPRSSRTVQWLDRPVDNPHKCRGNIGLGLGYPLDASSNTNHITSTHRGSRVRCFFRRCKRWLQGVRDA